MRKFNLWLIAFVIFALPVQGFTALVGMCASHHGQPMQATTPHDCVDHQSPHSPQPDQDDGTCSLCAFCHAGHSIAPIVAISVSNSTHSERIAFESAPYLSPASAVLDPPPKLLSL